MKDPACRVAPERGGPSRKRRPSRLFGIGHNNAGAKRRPQSVACYWGEVRRAAAEQERHPCNGAPPTGGVAASRAMTRLSRHRRSAASRSECGSDARTTRREVRVPAVRTRRPHPQERAARDRVRPPGIPLRFPRSRSLPAGPRLQAWFALANRAGRRQAAPKCYSNDLRGRNQRSVAHPFEQILLLRFQFDQHPQHIEDIDQLGGIFGQPVIGLDVAER